LDSENQNESYVDGLKELLRGRYAMGYVLSQNLRQYRGDTPEHILDSILDDKENGCVHRTSFRTSDGELDFKITVGVGDDSTFGNCSSKQKAVSCGALAYSEAGTEGTKVCSVWFEDKPEPSKAGTAECFHVKTIIMEALSGEVKEIPVDVVIAYHG